jgi:hypothetical protein
MKMQKEKLSAQWYIGFKINVVGIGVTFTLFEGFYGNTYYERTFNNMLAIEYHIKLSYFEKLYFVLYKKYTFILAHSSSNDSFRAK